MPRIYALVDLLMQGDSQNTLMHLQKNRVNSKGVNALFLGPYAIAEEVERKCGACRGSLEKVLGSTLVMT